MSSTPFDESLLQDELTRFAQLQRLVADSSSLIYLDRLGQLQSVMQVLELVSVPGVAEETGFALDLPLFTDLPAGASVDQRIIAAARQQQLPVLSDDRHILRAAEGSGTGFYNTGMILCYLRYRGRLDAPRAQAAWQQLESFARYAGPIRAYCRQLLQHLDKCS
ncbi:hypothetical protein [Spirochaeta africana]|uniref:Uncharacterized protein n=1 Tax=Spirochaeta africana (strain ATCC 700263 / DSM 8902 / Z-7692) TaxID=889378 RepID=H9UMG7_SPIAZ|nr:hypothetical protein [Spirochaeta africana]AFG38710.1 hypothetical protein Spiaf_2684 [Spirochaeta africana DSM 8902]